MTATPTVTLQTNGSVYRGWTAVTVVRAIDALAGWFTLELEDEWKSDKDSGSLLPFAPGASCTVSLDDDVVLAGYVDEASPSFGRGRTSLYVAGRDAPADLVDCSVDDSTCEWSGLTLLRLARRIARPFGIDVVDEAGNTKVFDKFSLQPGETAFEALDRACGLRGVLPTADTKGRIVLRKPGQAYATDRLVQGGNVLSAQATYSNQSRFSHYTVRAQQPGSDTCFGDDAAQVTATARDATITRYRPKTLTISNKADTADARRRAEWEAAIGAARGMSCDVRVAGWRQRDGSLWTVGDLVDVHIPWLRMNACLLIAEVRWSMGARRGPVTDLRLARPDAYVPQPELDPTTDPTRWVSDNESTGQVPA